MPKAVTNDVLSDRNTTPVMSPPATVASCCRGVHMRIHVSNMTDAGSRPLSLAPGLVGPMSASSLLCAGALSWSMTWLEKSMVGCLAVLDSEIQFVEATTLGNKIMFGCCSNEYLLEQRSSSGGGILDSPFVVYTYL